MWLTFPVTLLIVVLLLQIVEWRMNANRWTLTTDLREMFAMEADLSLLLAHPWRLAIERADSGADTSNYRTEVCVADSAERVFYQEISSLVGRV